MKFIVYVCDRCNAQLRAPDKLRTPNEGETLPIKWGFVNAKLLCAKCWQDLETFLGGARIEYVQVNHEEPIA